MGITDVTLTLRHLLAKKFKFRPQGRRRRRWLLKTDGEQNSLKKSLLVTYLILDTGFTVQALVDSRPQQLLCQARHLLPKTQPKQEHFALVSLFFHIPSPGPPGKDNGESTKEMQKILHRTGDPRPSINLATQKYTPDYKHVMTDCSFLKSSPRHRSVCAAEGECDRSTERQLASFARLVMKRVVGR